MVGRRPSPPPLPGTKTPLLLLEKLLQYHSIPIYKDCSSIHMNTKTLLIFPDGVVHECQTGPRVSEQAVLDCLIQKCATTGDHSIQTTKIILYPFLHCPIFVLITMFPRNTTDSNTITRSMKYLVRSDNITPKLGLGSRYDMTTKTTRSAVFITRVMCAAVGAAVRTVQGSSVCTPEIPV